MISFIIPAYNEEKYIKDCMQSILNQKRLDDFEIIVVDNDSRDQTAEIVVADFPEARIIHERKQSPAAARNAGAKAARGKYLAFIDADCRLPKLWHQKVIENFSSDPDLVLLFGPYKYYEDKAWWEKALSYFGNVIAVQAAKFILGDLLGLGTPGYGGNTVIKKQAFDRLGGFSEEYDFYGEDTDLTSRAFKAGKVRFTPKLWLYSSKRRLHDEGIFKMWWKYTVNFIWAVLFKKPWHRENKQVR